MAFLVEAADAVGVTPFDFAATGAQVLFDDEAPTINKAPAIPNVHNPWIYSDNFSLFYKCFLNLRLCCSMNKWIVNYSNN